MSLVNLEVTKRVASVKLITVLKPSAFYAFKHLIIQMTINNLNLPNLHRNVLNGPSVSTVADNQSI